MIQLLYASSVSACFELDSSAPFYAPLSFRIFLNGEEVRREGRNVFSLFSLQPSSSYTLDLLFDDGKKETLSFRTQAERCAVNVRDFGAVGDGETNDTVAIQTAIACLPAGGRLIFPPGCYLTSPLSLKSDLTLDFQEGAHLLGSPTGRTIRSFPVPFRIRLPEKSCISAVLKAIACRCISPW